MFSETILTGVLFPIQTFQKGIKSANHYFFYTSNIRYICLKLLLSVQEYDICGMKFPSKDYEPCPPAAFYWNLTLTSNEKDTLWTRADPLPPLIYQRYNVITESCWRVELLTRSSNALQTINLSTFKTSDFLISCRMTTKWNVEGWNEIILDVCSEMQGWAGMTFGSSGTGTGMDNSIPKVWEREENGKTHSQNSRTGKECKKKQSHKSRTGREWTKIPNFKNRKGTKK